MSENLKKKKARDLRYRKAIVKDINLSNITSDLYDIIEECYNVQYFMDNDEETLLNALDGDEDDAYEFKMMFSDLCAECEQMQEDLQSEYIPNYFDDFFTSVSNGEDLLGWDFFEGDYYGLYGGYEENLARNEARKRISILKKEEIIEGAQLCFRVFKAYMGLRHRYDCLKSAFDILKDENTKFLQVIKKINESYERANNSDFWGNDDYEFDKLIELMPSEVWLQ